MTGNKMPEEEKRKKWEERVQRRREAWASYEGEKPAAQIAGLRTQRGLSQEELARRTHMKHTNISRLERGHNIPSLVTLHRIAQALDARLVVRLEPKEVDHG